LRAFGEHHIVWTFISGGQVVYLTASCAWGHERRIGQ